MRPSAQAPDAGERGFILVGVVTFMLALTILGLSLFALSSYEAQFFTASASREQSLQNAESGMELVKALLQLPPQRLENAQLAVGQRGVTSAMAYQWRSNLATDTSSVGPVNWDSTLVVVTAASGGAERTLQARFIPTPAQNPYQTLLTAGLGIRCNTDNGTPADGLELRGPVWQFVDSPADTSWTELLTWTTGRPMITGRPALPLADAFVDAHLAGATQPSLSGSGPYSVSLSNTGSGPRFFVSPLSPDDDESNYPERALYTFYVGDDLTVRVRGTVVWVVPEGACFRRNVTVEPLESGVPGTLVMVAKANHHDPDYWNRGIWLQGGLTLGAEEVSVFLVSEGDIAITRAHNRSATQTARRVSVVAAGDIEVGGPYSGDRQRLHYDASRMGPLAEQLIGQGALPPLTASSSMTYVIARSSWAETTPR